MRRPLAVTRISIAILLVAGQLSAQSLDPPPPPAQNPGASEQARIDELERRVRELGIAAARARSRGA
jgi:hypothetical protein